MQAVGYWGTYFQKNLQGRNCNVDRCYLKDATCTNDYRNENIWISRSTVGELVNPDQVNALANTTLGYDENLCVECQLKEDKSIIQNKINIKSSGKLKKAQAQFNYLLQENIFPPVFDTAEACIKRCGRLFWKRYCCATNTMTSANPKEKGSREAFYCIDQLVADELQNKTESSTPTVYSGVKFDLRCGVKVSSGAERLRSLFQLALVGMIYY